MRAGLTSSVKEDSDEYIQADRLITLYCLLFAVFAIVEFLIMFGGATMFTNQINLLQIAVHVICEICLLVFIIQKLHYQWLAVIVVFTSFVPMVIEALSAINASRNYRRISGSKA